MKASRLIHGPFEDRRDVPSKNVIEAGDCPCRLCEETGVSRQAVGGGHILVRQPDPATLADGERRGARISDPLWIFDVRGTGWGASP